MKKKIPTSAAQQQPDMLVSCEEIIAPIRVQEDDENYRFIYRPETDTFISGHGQWVSPGWKKFVLWGPRQPCFLLTVQKRIELSLVIDTLPVGDFEKLIVLEKPRFFMRIVVCVKDPQRLLKRLDKQCLNLSAMEFCVKNIKHFRKALESHYRGGNNLSGSAFQDTDLERIFNRFGLILTDVKLIRPVNRRFYQK